MQPEVFVDSSPVGRSLTILCHLVFEDFFSTSPGGVVRAMSSRSFVHQAANTNNVIGIVKTQKIQKRADTTV